jgi:transcription elongation factor Elf1
MPVTQAMPFQCPTCDAEYKLVRVETKEAVPDQQVTCRKCGSVLPGSEGHLVLKYFFVDRGRRRTSGARMS